MHARQLRSGLCSAAAVLMVCGAAAAQQPALGDGHALDRNLLVGSGGYIAKRESSLDAQLRFNNAVMYGTAVQGKAFQGSSGGIRAPDQFGAHLGSDDQYTFRRDSAFSGLTGAGVRSSDALRYQFAMTTGLQAPAQIAPLSSGIPRSGTVTISSNSAALRSTAEYVTARSYNPAILGSRRDPSGGSGLTARASPLLGVLWAQNDDKVNQPLPLPSQAPTPPGSTVPGADRPGSVHPGSTQPGSTQPGSVQPGSVQPGSVQPGTAQPGSAPAGTAPGILPSGVRDNPFAPGAPSDGAASRRPGEAGSTRVNQASVPVHSRVMQQVATTFQQAAATPARPDQVAPGTTPGAAADAKPVDGSLEAQLDRLRASLRGTPDEPPTTRPTIPDPMAGGPDARPGEKPATDGTKTAGAGATKSRPGDNPPSAKPATAQTTAGSQDQSQPNVTKFGSDKPTEDLLKAIRAAGDQRIDRLTPATPAEAAKIKNPGLYQEMMSAGEEFLGKGRFFDAEDRFGRAIGAMPGDPMARSGRILAQLGAGMYLSGAANLRSLFIDHPELVAVRFGPNLLPNDQRAARIAEQLQIEMANSGSALGRDSALLLAYLGHQRGDNKMVETGLTEFGTRLDPSETADLNLLVVLRATWSK